MNLRAVCAAYVNQNGNLESEMDHLPSSPTEPEVVALPSTEPVTGESFCNCDRQEELSAGFTASSDCLCGEEDQGEQQLINSYTPYERSMVHYSLALAWC